MPWLNQLNQVQFGKNFIYLTTTCLLELLVSEYLRETNISIFISHCFLFFRCREKGFEEERTRIKMEIVEVLQQASYCRQRSGWWKFLALTSYLLARITMTLMSSFSMPVVFKKSIFRNLTFSCHLHSCMRYECY